MYQDFGAREVDNTRTVRFRLFIPDNALDPNQYTSGGSPNIAKIHVIGEFEEDLGKTNWQVDPLFELKKTIFTDPEDGQSKGWLYELITAPLPERFYQYKFHITYNSGKNAGGLRSLHAVWRCHRSKLGVRYRRTENGLGAACRP